MSSADEIYDDMVVHFNELKQDVLTMDARRQVIESLDDEIVRLQRPGSEFVLDRVLRPLYADGQALLVRRLVDPGRQAASLVRLLLDMEANATTVLTRERFHHVWLNDRHQDHWRRRADEHFDTWAGPGADHVRRTWLAGLRKKVTADGATVKSYVDQRVAHKQRKSDMTITWGDLNGAIEALKNRYTTVGVILTASSHMPDLHVQGNWKQVFAQGLFE
jgi:hypothetical protein